MIYYPQPQHKYQKKLPNNRPYSFINLLAIQSTINNYKLNTEPFMKRIIYMFPTPYQSPTENGNQRQREEGEPKSNIHHSYIRNSFYLLHTHSYYKFIAICNNRQIRLVFLMTKPMFQKCIINTLDNAYYYEKIINILRFLKTKQGQ